MGYSIYIGNATMELTEDGDFRIFVKEKKLRSAPVFPNDHMTGISNGRHPSYTGWANFCREAGLYELFLGKDDGLMAHHPGCHGLTEKHLAEVRAALKNWKRTHPNSTAGFEVDSFMRPEFQDKVENPDPILARLIWLEFWFDWALKTCKMPAIYNS